MMSEIIRIGLTLLVLGIQSVVWYSVGRVYGRISDGTWKRDLPHLIYHLMGTWIVLIIMLLILGIGSLIKFIV